MSETVPAEYLRWRDLYEAMMRQYSPGRDSCLELTQMLLQFLIRAEQPAVLDLGCGAGRFIEETRRTFPNARITAVDRSARSLQIARTLVGSEQISWVQQDFRASTWPESLQSGAFDAVFCSWALHEVEPWELGGVYSRLRRSLRSGGVLLVADFMGGMQPGVQELAFDLTRAKVTDEWSRFNSKFEQRPEIRDLAGTDKAPRTRWIVRHPFAFHGEALGGAGFHTVDCVWRYLDSTMLLAIG